MAQKVVVNLHTHEKTASPNSKDSMEQVAEFYRNRSDLPVFIGFVGHDKIPKGETPTLAIKGVERSLHEGSKLHVVDFPDHNFSFLAHPELTFVKNKKKQINRLISLLDLDGVEKYRGGAKQFSGETKGIALANDDAHNMYQVMSSYMTVQVPETEDGTISEEDVMNQVKQGNVTLHNTKPRKSSFLAGKVSQGLSMMKD